ncbi:hypothetical protein J6590_027770 [Homalodisca vitripennis]|nr:hypothetical protein J6590_027770 [Homalodisca vitripennis]
MDLRRVPNFNRSLMITEEAHMFGRQLTSESLMGTIASGLRKLYSGIGHYRDITLCEQILDWHPQQRVIQISRVLATQFLKLSRNSTRQFKRIFTLSVKLPKSDFLSLNITGLQLVNQAWDPNISIYSCFLLRHCHYFEECFFLWSKTLDFEAELEIAQVQILSVTFAFFISTIDLVLYRPSLSLIRSSYRLAAHKDGQNKA